MNKKDNTQVFENNEERELYKSLIIAATGNPKFMENYSNVTNTIDTYAWGMIQNFRNALSVGDGIYPNKEEIKIGNNTWKPTNEHITAAIAQIL